MKKSIILGISALMATPVLAEVTVQGTIRDAYTQEPLSGVSVQAFSDVKIVTMTDSVGKYQLTLPDHVSSLRIKREGYNTLQVPVGKADGAMDVSLYSDAFNEIVGLGQSSQQILSVNISDLTSDISVDDQISSSLGGQLRSINRGGVPGMGAFMLLNGINTLNSNAQPLVVLDGVILDMQYERTSLHDGFYNNLLSTISVDDIASVSILRNGTAIYGARGANGVILIDTKRSHSFNTKIDANISGRFEMTPVLPEMMNASEYRTYVSEMLGTTDTKLRDFKFLREDPNYYYYRVYHNNTDWSKEAYREAYSQHYSINVQGGDDVANYNLSLGYAQADAALKMNDFSRFNLRLNSDVKLANHISVRLDASYSDVNRDMRDDGAPMDVDRAMIVAPGFLSLIKSPFLSPYQYDTQGKLSHFLSQADDYLDRVLGANEKEGSLANPTSILHYGDARNKNSFGNRMVTLGITPKFELPHNITVSDCFSFVLNNTDEGYYIPVYGIPSFYIEGAGTVTNLSQSSSSHQYLTSNDLRINWKYAKEGHKLDVLGGWRYSLNRYQQNGLRGYSSSNDKTPDMSMSLRYKTTQGVSEKVTTLTYYAQAAYSLNDKYYLDAAISMEADTRFGKDADKSLKMFDVAWGFFPSVSASWVATNEDWMPKTDWLDYLRVTAGWDMTGNDDISIDAARSYFHSIKLFDRVCGYTIGGIGNTKIKWETTKRITYGIESNLMNNRLSLAVNAYKSWTSDLLSLQSLPGLIGLTENWGNGGALENAGFDVSLQGKIINSRDWHWQLGLSVGHYKNEITALPDNRNIYTDIYNGTIATMIGQPVGLFYGYKTKGVYATSEEAKNAGQYITDRTGAKKYFQGGDVRFINQDDSKEINENDRVVIGNPNPAVFGNISSHLQWKKLALDVVFNYSLGNDVYNYQRSLLEAGSRFQNQTTAMRGRWSSEGQETDIPRIAYQDPMGNSRFSDRWIEDGSYLRLKNVTVSYKWDFNYRFLQGLTVWGSAQNLMTLTKYLGSDPEFSVSNNVLLQGIDCGMLPANRNFSVGVKINL